MGGNSNGNEKSVGSWQGKTGGRKQESEAGSWFKVFEAGMEAREDGLLL
jgi:hypothetical protein